MASGAAPSRASPVPVVRGCPAPLNLRPLPGQLWAGSEWVMEQERMELFPPGRLECGGWQCPAIGWMGKGGLATGFGLYEPLVTSKRTAGQPEQVSLPPERVLELPWAFLDPLKFRFAPTGGPGRDSAAAAAVGTLTPTRRVGKGSLLAPSRPLPPVREFPLPQAGRAAGGPGLGDGVPENTGVPRGAASGIPKPALTSCSDANASPTLRTDAGGSAPSGRGLAPRRPGAGRVAPGRHRRADRQSRDPWGLPRCQPGPKTGGAARRNGAEKGGSCSSGEVGRGGGGAELSVLCQGVHGCAHEGVHGCALVCTGVHGSAARR